MTELVNYRKDGTAFINALHMAPLFDTNGKMQLFYGSQMDTTETVTANLARRKRAMKLSGIGIWEFTPVSKDSFFDNTMLDLFDIPQDQNDIVFDDLFSKVHADDHQRVRASSYAWFKDSSATYNEDFRIVLCNDQIRWIRCTGGMARASDGSGNQSVIGTAVDITREKEYELALSQAHDTIKTIADELDHRMNNVFATMASMVSASARGESDAKIAAAKTRERIMAMAVANKLTIGKGIHGEALLRDLITGALNPYMGTSTIEIDGEPVQLPRKTLNSLGLIFHELSTNSVKYGALNGAGGRLSVKWNVSDDGHCQIDWKEQNGKQYELPTASTGFGTNLVDLTVNQISGSIQRDFTKMGLEVRISFPLPKDP